MPKVNRVRETITNIMVERIEARRAAGENPVAPWRKTWDPTVGMPRNLISNKPYRGSNVWMTLLAGYTSPFWLTRNQMGKLDGSIKLMEDGKAEPYTPIFFWVFPDEEKAKAGWKPFCKFYQVWNLEQVDGIEDHPNLAVKVDELREPCVEAEGLVNGYRGRPEIRHGGGRACYVPNSDEIRMPEKSAFECEEEYYRVLFHELTHSTGHRNRLAREGIANPARFASHAYSEEELVAEMGATMLAGYAGIASEEADENSAAYLDTWLKKLKAEPRMLVTAGALAAKAVDLIRGIKWGNAE